MGTAETLIVFSALMALIALVTIGIDWIGKPLKHRRFIPRIYRFDDEKLPVDEYGNTRFDPEAVAPAGPVQAMSAMQPPPMVVAGVAPTVITGLPASPPQPRPGAKPSQPPTPAPRRPNPVPRVGARSGSAFTDSLAADDTAFAAGAKPAPVIPEMTDTPPPRPGAWTPGMVLDTTVDDRKPSLAVKAERFWQTMALSAEGSHFDEDDLARMRAGKAPRRANPRSGRAEAMQLSGLRQASEPNQVRMHWPDDSVDPWSRT